MDDWQATRLTETELKEFFDRLFPRGFAGVDVLSELAPDGWEKSPLLACFHPTPDQVFRECQRMHRRLEDMLVSRRKRDPDNPKFASKPELTFEEVLADWKNEPVNVAEEMTELVGRCMWDVFSDAHDVVVADGRLADLGSFRAAGGFIACYLDGTEMDDWGGDYLRFYMGTSWISSSDIHDRADLTPVYAMIFRRLKSLGAEWVYHFPEIGLVDFGPSQAKAKQPEEYSPSEAFADEQKEQKRQVELEKARAELAEIHELSRREALDRPPPPIVRAYQEVYGRDPKGWPPA